MAKVARRWALLTLVVALAEAAPRLLLRREESGDRAAEEQLRAKESKQEGDAPPAAHAMSSAGRAKRSQERPAALAELGRRNFKVNPMDDETYEHLHGSKPPISLEGLTAWFRSEEAQVPWPSMVGSHQGQVVSQKADASLELGHGAENVRFLRGDEKTRVDFGQILERNSTVCSVTRYTGEPYGRILQGSEFDWLQGQHDKKTGVACAAQETPKNLSLEDWVVVCASSDSEVDALVNGQNVSQKGCENIMAKQHLVINHGKMWQEVSSWGVMELIVWHRPLAWAELSQASAYLWGKLQNGTEEEFQISKPDGACNGRRVQVQLLPSPDGWRHDAEGGDPTDSRAYEVSDAAFGTAKIVESALPIVSERNPDELAPWAHSSLQGKAFVITGNRQGPRALSFFALERDLTVRIYVNGSELKDVKLEHGASAYAQGHFQNSHVMVMGTSNFLMYMSGEDQKFSTPVAPAAKSIFGISSEEWYVTSLKGELTNITQECSDGTSYSYVAKTLTWEMHDARRNSNYVKGPSVSKEAAEICESWTGTLAQAVKRCDARADCRALLDARCDGVDWQICLVGVERLKDGDGDEGNETEGNSSACTKVKTASSSSLLQKAAAPGWYKLDPGSQSCSEFCGALSLTCSSDSSLLSSAGKMKVAMESVGRNCSTVEDPVNGSMAGSYRLMNEQTICTPADERAPLNCNTSSEAVSKICYCSSGEQELFQLAKRGSNMCPERYLAVESREDCESLAATNEMPGVVVPIAWSGEDPNNQGSPSGCFKDLETGKVRFNSISLRGFDHLDGWQSADHRKICKKAFHGPDEEPMCKFTAQNDQVFLGGVSYDRAAGGGSSVVSFLPPGVFQADTQMPFGISEIQLISNKNASCHIKGKNYRLYGHFDVFSLRLKDRDLEAMEQISCTQNVMAIGIKNMSNEIADSVPRLNLLSATACQAAKMRGVGGLVLDTVLHLEPGFVFMKTLEKTTMEEVETISKEEFNQLAEPYNKYPVVKRLCPSCAATHTEIHYRRFTPLGEFSLYEAMACKWDENENNVQGKDFKLFSNLNDAFADTNEWKVCTYSMTRGFPGECGPSSAVSEQWNSIPVDAGSSSGLCTTDRGGRPVSFYMFKSIVPQKFRLGLSLDQDGEVTTLGEAEFNRRFQESRYHIILRKCQSCVESHKYIFYRVLTNPESFEPYKLLACDWKSTTEHAFHVDFKLYGDLQDALADKDPWDFCGFDGSGFPGTCSPTGKAKSGQSNYIPVSGCDNNTASNKAVSFELLEDEVLDVDELGEEEEAAKVIQDAVLPSGTVAAEGLRAWFRSEDAGATWKSVVGNFTAQRKNGMVRSATRHYGAEMKHIYGDRTTSFVFGDILPNTYTICSLSAYTGIAQDKVLRGENWWHGHAQGEAGSVFYGKWVRDETNLTGTRSWIALCASNQHEYLFIDGEERRCAFSGVGGPGVSVGINTGPIQEHSDWAVAEVIVWDRVLTRTEMLDAQNYLRSKAKVCQPEQSAQCDNTPCVSLFVGPNQHNVMFRNEDGTATVKTYLGEEIICKCRGHCRGLVGSWHCDNGPYGGFYTISASYADDWTKETTRDSLLLCSVARPVWSKKDLLGSQVALELGEASQWLKETSFTFAATARRDAAGGPLTLFSAGHDSSSENTDLRIFSGEDLTFVFNYRGESCQSAVTEGSQEGQWQHLAFTYDLDKNETRIYLNALEVKACPFQWRYSPDEQAKVMIGAYQGNARWTGALKDLALYAEPLSAAMIGRLAGALAVPKAMVWFSFRDGWNRQSYIDAVSFCVKRHMKLAHFEDYCQGEGNLTVSPKSPPGDQWAPLGGAEENSWVQIGDGQLTQEPTETCRTYEQAFSRKPVWGMDGKGGRYKSFLACKASKGFIMYPSDKGLGKCTGTLLPQPDEAKSGASCKMNCIKQSGCGFASWSEEEGKCRLFGNCTSWQALPSASTWVKKPLG